MLPQGVEFLESRAQFLRIDPKSRPGVASSAASGQLLASLLDRRGNQIRVVPHRPETVDYEPLYLDRGDALGRAGVPSPAMGAVAKIVSIPDPPLLAEGG